MSKHVSQVAFFATVLVVVPAGWRALDATIERDGPAARPKQHILHTGDAAVTVDLDRGVMMAGGKLKVTLVGTADTAHKVSLDVRALQDNGIGEERVSNPPTVVGKRRITIEAAPGGGKPTEVTFQLGSTKRKGVVQWYDVDVTPAGVKADHLNYDDDEPGTEGSVANAAKVGAVVWAGNTFGMVIEPPPTIPATGPFQVAVRIKNTTRKSLDWVDVTLGGPELDYNGMEGLMMSPDLETSPFEVSAIEAADDPVVAPGQERAFMFTVTPKTPGLRTFTLVANARAGRGGALDVITFERPAAADAAPAVAKQ